MKRLWGQTLSFILVVLLYYYYYYYYYYLKARYGHTSTNTECSPVEGAGWFHSLSFSEFSSAGTLYPFSSRRASRESVF